MEEFNISTTKAIKEIEREFGITISLPTMIAWIKKYDLGYKLEGRWICSKEKLNDFIERAKG